jgi:MacB-like periplasmic core domain
MNIRIVLLTVTLAFLATGCVPGAEQTVSPPEGTYTPARFEVVAEGVTGPVDGAMVTPDFFAVSQTRPLLGRFLTTEEFTAPSPVAVISHRYWVERFRSNPAAIGSQVQVDGRQTTIVGVAPPHFQTRKDTLLWIPKRI